MPDLLQTDKNERETNPRRRSDVRDYCARTFGVGTVTLLAAMCVSAQQQPTPTPSISPIVPSSSAATSPVATDVATPPLSSTVAIDAGGRDAQIATLRRTALSGKKGAERAQASRQLVELLIGANRREEAISELRRVFVEDRFDPVGFYNIGNQFARLNDPASAANAYRKAIEQRRGNYAKASNNLGVVLMRLGDLDAAHDAFQTALRQENFTYAEASYNLGRLYDRRGEIGFAINAWRRAVSLQATHTEARLALARALAHEGDTENALALLRSAQIPNDETTQQKVSEARRVIGEIAARNPSGNKTAALEVSPATYDLLKRARAARDGGRLEEAVTLYGQAAKSHGDVLAPASLELSFVLSGLKRSDEAIATLEQLAAKRGKDYPLAYYHLGRLYEQSNRLEEAATNLTRATELLSTTEPQIYLDLSRVREKQNDFAGALRATESYLTIVGKTERTPEGVVERLARLRLKVATQRQTSGQTPEAPPTNTPSSQTSGTPAKP